MFFGKDFRGLFEYLNVLISIQTFNYSLFLVLLLTFLNGYFYFLNPLLLKYFFFSSEGNVLKTIVNDKSVLIFRINFYLRNLKTNSELGFCFSFVCYDQFVLLEHHVEISPRTNSNNPLKYLNVAFHYNIHEDKMQVADQIQVKGQKHGVKKDESQKHRYS